MLGAAVILPALLAVAYASGEFSVLVSPKSLEFKGNEKLDSSSLDELYASAVGKATNGQSEWSGLHIVDPFDLPENAIAFVVDGTSNLKLDTKSKSYSLTGSNAADSLDSLSSALSVVDVDLNEGVDKIEQYPDIFGATEIPSITKETSNLKPQLHSEDKLFLQQVAVLNKLAESLSGNENLPALTVIRVSLAPIRNAHGDKSAATQEAEQLLTAALENIAASLRTNKSAPLVTVIASTSEHIRNRRQATPEPKATAQDINVATYYDEDYPVIFNIILWFMVVLAFSLLAISYAIATMDPGRDSIIYRMTSTRMKKDN